MRTTLETIIKRVQKELVHCDPIDTYHCGRLIEATDLARDLLFNVLNTASSYCECENAKEAIDGGRVKP